MKKYLCVPCDYIYDPEIGDPDGGIDPGTAFEDIPDDWVCPLCGAGVDDLVKVHGISRSLAESIYNNLHLDG